MTKKALAITIAVLTVLLTSCGTMPAEEKTGSTATQTVSFPAGNETESNVESSETESKKQEPEKNKPAETGSATEKATNSKNTNTDENVRSSGTPKKKPSQQTKTPETESPETESSGTEQSQSQAPENSEHPAPPNQTADPAEVERLVAEYVNQYRSTPATVLSGLTEVARYRSRQIINNFSHETDVNPCDVLKYGEFVDMTLYGGTDSDSYYRGYNREAICKGNWEGSAKEVAGKIADGFKNSAEHWSYLGLGEYPYMAVGCTYDEATSMWYCCICVSAENYGG